MISERTIREAVSRLLAAAPQGSEVILFGSGARGDAGQDSDLDFLVVEPAVENRIAEAARLYRSLVGLRIPVDVVVVSREDFGQWKDTPGNVIFAAATEGRVFNAAVASASTDPS